MRLKIKNRLQRYDIRDIQAQTWIFEPKFMKKLRNTEAELNKSLAYKKSVLNMIFVNDICWHSVGGEAMKG